MVKEQYQLQVMIYTIAVVRWLDIQSEEGISRTIWWNDLFFTWYLRGRNRRFLSKTELGRSIALSTYSQSKSFMKIDQWLKDSQKWVSEVSEKANQWMDQA